MNYHVGVKVYKTLYVLCWRELTLEDFCAYILVIRVYIYVMQKISCSWYNTKINCITLYDMQGETYVIKSKI